ncbi:MAG TPA: fibro-slime domain-containing protein [Kofleriaceae bacterium]|nr:fibro-slime domain-containing protein [Kofleriaceae bacterium]
MRIAALWLVSVALGCGANTGVNRDGGGGNGDGQASGDGGGGSGDAQNCGALTATLRDFLSSHPDFEKAIADDRGLVRADLGADGKPVYAAAGATATVSGVASFDQWYRDTAGVNMTFSQPLPLTENPPGTFTFDDSSFFPLDGMGFQETFLGHNFHFTTEIHTSFVYRGGEQFTFVGDDDVWVFVNRKLGLDLGGVHGAETATIDFDAKAAELGITKGGTYQLDVFHAERHTSESNFRMVTTIDCFIVQ